MKIRFAIANTLATVPQKSVRQDAEHCRRDAGAPQFSDNP